MKKEKKILLVEDFSGEAKGIISRLHEIPDYKFTIDWEDNPDIALKKIINNHYDLLICDLHFRKEGIPFKITNGEDLIIQIKKLKKTPYIIVHSMIKQPVTLDLIVNSIGIDAYIIKGRKSLDELAYSLNLIFIGGQYMSRDVKSILDKYRNAMQIDKMNRNILRFLYKGHKVKDLPSLLKKDGFSACSLPTVENRIKELKDYFDVTSTTQLVAVAKEKKIFIG